MAPSLGLAYAHTDGNALFTDLSTIGVDAIGRGASSSYDVGFQRLVTRRVLLDVELAGSLGITGATHAHRVSFGIAIAP